MNKLPANIESDFQDLSDQALLHLFALHANHAAFAEVVRRYQKLVMSVCLRTVRNSQDAEDAFQATFIALAKRPTQLRKSKSLSSWLYSVAWRTSVRAARRRIQRKARQIPENTTTTAAEPFEEISKIRDMTVLEEELNKLPEHYRSVLVMNFLAGHSNQQIADQLQASRGVIDGRIQRAKNALRVRLVRRGVTMTILGSLAAACTKSANAAPALIEQSVSDGIGFMSGSSTTTKTITSLARPETVGASLPTIPSAAAAVVLAVTLSGWFAAVGNDAVAFEEPTLKSAIEDNSANEETNQTTEIAFPIDEPESVTKGPPKKKARETENTESSSATAVVASAESPTEPKETAEEQRERKLLEFDGDWGSITGQILLDGKAPSPELIHAKGANIKDKQVCSAVALYDLSLQVDPKTNGIENCFVYLLRARTIHPLLAEPEVKTLLQDQINCQFVPHCQIVRVGQAVNVVSSDSVAHNIHTYPFRNHPTSTIAPQGTRKATGLLIKPTTRELLPFPIACDFHPWMKGHWLVLDHPYAAKTDSQGRFRISGLPAGKHKLRLWHERVGYIERDYEIEVIDGEVTELKPVTVELERFAKIAASNQP